MYILVSKVKFTKKWRKNSGAILSFSIRFGRVEIPDYLPKKHVQVSDGYNHHLRTGWAAGKNSI